MTPVQIRVERLTPEQAIFFLNNTMAIMAVEVVVMPAVTAVPMAVVGAVLLLMVVVVEEVVVVVELLIVEV